MLHSLKTGDGRVPTLAIHPKDLERGFWPRILRLTEELLDAGYEPSTPAMLFEATRESQYAALYQEAAGETLSVAGDENSALADFAGAFNQLELVRIRSEYERLTAGGVPSETERRRIQELSRRLAELKGAPVPGARPQA